MLPEQSQTRIENSLTKADFESLIMINKIKAS